MTGKVVIPLTLKEVGVTFEFYVLPELSQNLILGRDFLQMFEGKIDFMHHCATFLNDGVRMELCQNVSRPQILRLAARVELQPYAEMLLPVTLSQRWKGGVGLVEPLPREEEQCYGVARSVVSPKGRRTVCRIVNPSEAIICLPKFTAIGTVDRIRECDISEIDRNGARPTTTCKNRSADIHQEQRPTRKYTIEELGIVIDSEKLSPEERHQLQNLINEFGDIFALSLEDLPGTHLFEHHIDTGDHPPQRSRWYKASPAAQTEIVKQIDDMLKSGVIEETSSSGWCSPVVLVRKKDGTFRFAINYKKLNSVTKPLMFPMVRFDEVLINFAETKPRIFSILDLRQAYFQMGVDSDSQEKTTFAAHGQSQYKFLRLPFGLSNSPVSFSLLMARVLKGALLKYAVAYLDDLLCYSSDFESHMAHLRDIFTRLRSANLRLHPKKCQFAVGKVSYLGYNVSAEGIQMQEDKIKAIREFKPPRNVKETRMFIGYCSFYRRFVAGFSRICGPLYNLLRKIKFSRGVQRNKPRSRTFATRCARHRSWDTPTRPSRLTSR